jgi:hypothetical protein
MRIPRRARPVFEKVAQIGALNAPERLWMREQSYSSEFFEFLVPELVRLSLPVVGASPLDIWPSKQDPDWSPKPQQRRWAKYMAGTKV